MVLLDGCKELGVVELAGEGIGDFSLTVDNVFLQVERDLFRGAEITHRVGHVYSTFLTKTEEIVDSCARCENHGGEIGKINLRLAELLRRESLHFDHGTEHNLHIVLCRYVKIGRFLGSRFGLGY